MASSGSEINPICALALSSNQRIQHLPEVVVPSVLHKGQKPFQAQEQNLYSEGLASGGASHMEKVLSKSLTDIIKFYEVGKCQPHLTNEGTRTKKGQMICSGTNS